IARAPELAVDLLCRALTRDAPAADTEQVEALRTGYVRALLVAGRPADAEQAVRDRPGDVTPPPVALRWLLAHACLQRGRPDTALAEAQQALRRADVSPGAAARLHGVSAQSLFLLGRLVEAEAAAGMALAAAAGRRARLWFFEGRWDDALAEIAAGREPADPLGLAPALDSLAAMVAVHRGEVPVLPQSTGGTAARCFDHLRRWVNALAAEADGHPEH